jgi:ERCC4-type nuclease
MVTNLDYGDVNVVLDNGDLLAIERKEIHDFLGSIGDGRLFDQAERMSKAKYSAIIVQGTLTYSSDDMAIANKERTNWSGVSVRGALYAVQFSGCPVLFCPEDWYPRIVQSLIEFVSKSDQHWQNKHRRIITFPPLDERISLLATFPNIGIKRATSMVEFCGKTEGNLGTLAESLCWASAMPLIENGSRPAGWGNKIAQNFREYLGLKPGQYLEIKEDKSE